ncbi:MAG: ribonuclease HI family protein [bacterium]
MPTDHEIIMTLARTLDVQATIEEHRIDEESLKELLLQIASALAGAESAAEPEPAPKEPEIKPEAGVEGGPLTIHIDGASRGNPGEAGAGVVITKDGKMVEGEAKYLGKMTCNQAEYNALIIGLSRAKAMGAREVEVVTDSELVAHQMNGVYKVKNPRIKKLYQQARSLVDSFSHFSIRHVLRENNKEADKLANRAIDEFKNSR